jgi:hypothetical protein
MENLSSAAQVTAIVVIGIVICVLILSSMTSFFDRD